MLIKSANYRVADAVLLGHRHAIRVLVYSCIMRMGRTQHDLWRPSPTTATIIYEEIIELPHLVKDIQKNIE